MPRPCFRDFLIGSSGISSQIPRGKVSGILTVISSNISGIVSGSTPEIAPKNLLVIYKSSRNSSSGVPWDTLRNFFYAPENPWPIQPPVIFTRINFKIFSKAISGFPPNIIWLILLLISLVVTTRDLPKILTGVLPRNST